MQPNPISQQRNVNVIILCTYKLMDHPDSTPYPTKALLVLALTSFAGIFNLLMKLHSTDRGNGERAFP